MDPDLLEILEMQYGELGPDDPRRRAVMVAVILWRACLRFKHLQRSVLIRLTATHLEGYCTLGKGKPGFPWSCPRVLLNELQCDVVEAVWSNWLGQSRAEGRALRFVGLDAHGGAMSMCTLIRDLRSVLAHALGSDALDLEALSTYSFRRVLPTMASILGMSEHQRLSMGDWQERGKVSAMPVRYDDQKAQAATEAKIHAVVAVALYAGACPRGECSWEFMRSMGVADMNQYIESALRGIPPSFVCIDAHTLDLPLSVPKHRSIRRASLAAKAQQVCRRKRESSSLLGCCDQAWVITSHPSGLLHFVDHGNHPWCKRKKGALGKPIRQIKASGTGIPLAGLTGAPVCRTCMSALPSALRSALPQVAF